MKNSTGSPDTAKESWPLANWVAPRAVLVPCGMGAFLFVRLCQGNLGGTARGEARPKGLASLFYFVRRVQQMMPYRAFRKEENELL